MTRFLLFFALAGPSLAAGGGLPRVRDLDGQPVSRPALVGWGDGVLIVVDSTAPEPRVLVEVVHEIPPEADPSFLPFPRLRIGSDFSLAPRRAVVEAPRCPQNRVEPRGPGRDPDVVVLVGAPTGAPCIVVVRAEFSLPTGLADWEQLAVVVGARVPRITWTRPPNGPMVVRR